MKKSKCGLGNERIEQIGWIAEKKSEKKTEIL